jgi:PTH1 family peptidyl-tRNA hydrolase
MSVTTPISPQLFVGLGNPGSAYAMNRHNAGFMVLDAIAQDNHAAGWQKKFHGLVTEININLSHRERACPGPVPGSKSAQRDAGEGQKLPASPLTRNFSDKQKNIRPLPQPLSRGEVQRVFLLKPQTYMNKSGLSVAEACRFYKIPPEAVTVFHDELDLPPGKIRIKTGGGHGGHNGLRDIDAHLGKNYRRIRLGIGHPGHKDAVSGYVLHDFSKVEREQLDHLIQTLTANLPLLITGEDAKLMNLLAQ